ncbi:Rax1 protein [Saccharomycopsis crataegensis]|uniref:Rax1 protein n=1 Tax=Saccharomycopsis crataegensis TaxID=43959 RepID=A0AAV5QPJ3_9ASCO|nr:Rax1 protein [Saccharomycopsis crataegensis]
METNNEVVVPNVGGTDIRETNNLKMNNYTSDNPIHTSLTNSSFNESQYSSSERINRLPTLFEVLNKKTESPVDLWSFYVFMRDEQHAVDYLDFWIDVVSHLALCKQYVKGLRESVLLTEKEKRNTSGGKFPENYPSGFTDSQYDPRNLAPLAGGNDRKNYDSYHSEGTRLPKTSSISSSVLLEALINEGVLDEPNSKRLSSFLRGEEPINDQRFSELLEKLQKSDIENSTTGENTPGLNHLSGVSAANNHALKSLVPELQKVYNRYSQSTTSNKNSMIQYPSFANAPPLPDDIKVSPEDIEKMVNDDALAAATQGSPSKVKREDLRSSSRRILVTYFIDNSEKKLQLPEKIIRQIRHSIEVQGRDDPEVFDEARDYVFQAMEREAFPNFLKSAALNNITKKSFNIRLVAGFFFFFVAFWVGYTLIFLGYSPKHDRATVTIPFFLGTYLLVTALFRLDPALCTLGYAESNASTNKHHYIELKEPYVKKLLFQRSIWVAIIICVISAAFSCLFSLVPGHRL